MRYDSDDVSMSDNICMSPTHAEYQYKSVSRTTAKTATIGTVNLADEHVGVVTMLSTSKFTAVLLFSMCESVILVAHGVAVGRST